MLVYYPSIFRSALIVGENALLYLPRRNWGKEKGKKGEKPCKKTAARCFSSGHMYLAG